MPLTRKQIITIGKECIQELNQYTKASDFFIYHDDGTLSSKQSLYQHEADLLHWREIMIRIREEQNLSFSTMNLAIAKKSKRANCSELCWLLLLQIVDKGIEDIQLVYNMYGMEASLDCTIEDAREKYPEEVKKAKDHNFILVPDEHGNLLVLDPFFNLCCSLDEFSTNPKILAFYNLDPKTGKFNYLEHKNFIFKQEDLNLCKENLEKELPIFLEKSASIEASNRISTKNILFLPPNVVNNRKKAIELYQCQQYDKAGELFSGEAVRLLDLPEEKRNTEFYRDLAGVFYNQGSCLLQMHEYKDAARTLKYALDFREKYDGENQESIKKITAKIEACDKQSLNLKPVK